MTFQEQCMQTVFPRFIEGINAANRKVGTLTSEVAQLQAKVQELEIQLADALDRVNMLEAKAAEKKTRKPRAKKQADPVQSVEEAAKRAAVDKAMDAVLSTYEPGIHRIAGSIGSVGVAGTAGETKTAGVSGTAELPPDMQGIF